VVGMTAVDDPGGNVVDLGLYRLRAEYGRRVREVGAQMVEASLAALVQRAERRGKVLRFKKRPARFKRWQEARRR